VIISNKRSKKRTIIPVNDITLLKKINTGKKIIYGAIGTVLVAGGAAIIDDGGNSPGNAMKDALLIPVIGTGVYFLCAVPVLLLIEKFNEKKRRRGWIFHLKH